MVSADLAPSEASLLSLPVASFSLCSYVIFPLCACVLMSSYKDASPTELGPTPMASFYLNYLLKSPVSKHGHVNSEELGMRASVYKFWGDIIQPITQRD